MTHGAAVSLAIALGVIVGGVAGMLAYDAVIATFIGRTSTISHGAWQAGVMYPWVPWVFVSFCLALTIFLAWHFWG